MRMTRYATHTALAILLSCGLVTLAFAIDRVGSQQKSGTTDSPAASGSEPGAQKAPMPTTASTISGELLKIEGGAEGEFYTVKDNTGKEVRLHVNRETKMDGSFQVGDRIEAQSNPAGHATSIKKASGGAGMPKSDSGR
jgi:hypothetical protein